MSVSSTFAKLANTLNVGLIYDRTSPAGAPLGSCFQFGPDSFVSVASILSPFRLRPQALKIVHSARDTEFSVGAISFHPDFKYSTALSEVERGSSTFNPAISHNCCFLHVGSIQRPLSRKTIEAVSSALRHPLDLSKDDFRGNLAEIDLSLIVQTLNNARRDGILYLCDNLFRPISQVYCLEGRIVAARYQNLANDLAIYQIIQKGLATKFAFFPMTELTTLTRTVLRRPVDTFLLEAARRLDELAPLKELLPDGSTFKVKRKDLDGAALSEEVRPFAAKILERLDSFVAIEELWLLADCDDYTIYKAISEMLSTGHVEIISSLSRANSESTHQFPNSGLAEIIMGNSLETTEKISSISMLPAGKQLVERSGQILSPQENEKGMFTHNILLLPEAIGSPIVQNGKIVGMHCGNTINYLEKSAEVRNAMLSMAAILDLRKVMLPVLEESERKIAQALKDGEDEDDDDTTDGATDASAIGGAPHTRKGLRGKKGKKSPVRNAVSLLLWFVFGYLFMVGANFAVEYLNGKNAHEAAPAGH